MLQQTLSLSLSFPIFYLIFSLLSVSSANSIIYVACSRLYFTLMTPYESNINSLFTSLVDSASTSNFNKFQICPPGYTQNDVVYGLFQCRGDLSSLNCRNCVANSVSQLKTYCPMSTGGNIQLEGCFVKYNNTSFFGIEDNIEVARSCGPSIGYSSATLNRTDDALTFLIAGNGQYFRKGVFESVQSVAQCVQDLTVSQCEDCLLEARARLRSECETSSWGNMYLGKCFIRYADQDNNNDADNDTYDYNDYDDDRDSSKKKRKKKSKGKPKQVRRWAITIGATVGGITSTVGLGITVAIIYKKYKRDKKRPLRRIIKSPSPSPSSPLPVSSPASPPPPVPLPSFTPPGHYCNVAGGCTCPIPPPFNEAFFVARNESYGNPWLRCN